jgi:hypothetical protein
LYVPPEYIDQTYSRLKPIDKFDDVRMLQPLQHGKLVIDHLLVAFDVLFQDDLDGNLASRAVRLTNDSICASTKGASEPVL